MRIKEQAWRVLFTAVLASAMTFGGNAAQGDRHTIGALCDDGTTSTATGGGACSHHGGVTRTKKLLQDCARLWGRGRNYPFSDNGVPDAFTRSAPKPEFPTGGLTITCPKCGNDSVFQRHQLIYQTA